jgi:hypothetical protein
MNEEINPLLKDMIYHGNMSLDQIETNIRYWTKQKEKAERAICQMILAKTYWNELNDGQKK